MTHRERHGDDRGGDVHREHGDVAELKAAEGRVSDAGEQADGHDYGERDRHRVPASPSQTPPDDHGLPRREDEEPQAQDAVGHGHDSGLGWLPNCERDAAGREGTNEKHEECQVGPPAGPVRWRHRTSVLLPVGHGDDPTGEPAGPGAASRLLSSVSGVDLLEPHVVARDPRLACVSRLGELRFGTTAFSPAADEAPLAPYARSSARALGERQMRTSSVAE